MGHRRSLLLWVLLGSLVFAGFVHGNEPAKFDLHSAIKYAEENSNQVKLAKIALENARVAYQEAQANLLERPSVVTRQREEKTWQNAQRDYELVRENLALQVAQVYYDVLRAQMALDLAKRNHARAKANLESTQARYELGMVSDVDRLAAESQLASAAVELNQAKASEFSARMRFNRILGRELEAPFDLVDEFAYEAVEIDLEKALEHALKTRLDFQQAQNTLELRRLEYEVSNNQYTPQLAIERARLAMEQAEIQLEEKKLDLILEVRQNYQNLLEAQARIPIQEMNSKRAQQSLAIAEERYRAGVITYLDLIDAQRAAFQAEMALIQAVFDYNILIARFNRVAGYPLVKSQ
ncbi:MAG: TolC family protein [Firmicutes bacterium]|jgi:outer membrane protein TolC|nr:TolC family protein [Bacillota bacterium]HQD40076.1 TolC family protein [Bacillota bacterium]